jgi:hypothetical protein
MMKAIAVAISRLYRALVVFIMAPTLALIALALKVEDPQAPILVRNSGGKLRFRANDSARFGRVLLRTSCDELAAFMDFRARRIFDKEDGEVKYEEMTRFQRLFSRYGWVVIILALQQASMWSTTPSNRRYGSWEKPCGGRWN